MSDSLADLIELPPDLADELATLARPLSERTPSESNEAGRRECGRLSELTGLPLVLAVGDRLVPPSDVGPLPWIPSDALAALSDGAASDAASVPTKADVEVAAVGLPSGAVAATVLPRVAGQPIPSEATVAAAAAGWTADRVEAWWRSLVPHPPGTAVRLLDLGSRQLLSDDRTGQLEWELESLADQIDSTYEEITLLHYLAQNLQRTHDTAELARLCLDRIGDSLHARGGAAWLQVGEGNTHFLTAGEVPFDEIGLARLIGSFDGHAWPQPLVRNHIRSRRDGEAPPESLAGLDNVVIVPVQTGGATVGWIVSLNTEDGREFGTVEASLLASVAVTLGTHVQNAEAVREREDLLLSFVKSFVSSLDAKDPYTRGHSERVAAIGAALARKLGCPDDEVEAIHLSGLLHDVGKIGIDDAVLGKPGHLTDEEFEQIKRHPTIGYQILGGIRSLAHILPGVRNHHESYDGTGYPDGLAGEGIPWQARILAVADSYDAMTSDRPYRNGMPLERLQSIFAEGRGTQWDPDVIDAYFAIADEVLELCEEWKRAQ